MASISYLEEHRNWEDWLGMALGLATAASPWVVANSHDAIVSISATAVGIVLFVVSAIELFDRQRWEQYAQMLCAAWLIGSPFLIDYGGSGMLSVFHVVMGIVVLLLAFLELGQSMRARQ